MRSKVSKAMRGTPMYHEKSFGIFVREMLHVTIRLRVKW